MDSESNTVKNSEDQEAVEIHSHAIVKKCAVEYPVQFQKLQSNTDLKQPPSNWYQEHEKIQLHNPCKKQADFTSFFMAHQFLDCIGQVDIVSDADNIKKLLKIPYNQKSHVSMMIHKVGGTLLIDEFNIYKYLLQQSEKEWKWLKKFFVEHVLQSVSCHEQIIVRPCQSRIVVQSRNLLSKFLHYSINDKDKENSSGRDQGKVPRVSLSPTRSQPALDFPEPSLNEQLPKSSVVPFSQDIIWHFENLRMLIGADLPIFGAGIHPCVSLRLRDMNNPISILTGIDYWLDNLMCNVPEVVMCYHLDGIVQKYELYKTEDLPQLADTEFSPKLVRDVAHNILSFLKRKATKEGHTYWLFKGKNDDIVKLYDLSTLSMEGEFALGQVDQDTSGHDQGNPFTVPVAMLFYRVAKNMIASEEKLRKPSTIVALLKNSIELLDENRHPKIVSSAHYMLSDIYIPQIADPEKLNIPVLEDEDSDLYSSSDSDVDDENYDDDCKSKSTLASSHNLSSDIKISSLCQPYHFYKFEKYRPPPVTRDLEERCSLSLIHVMNALICLKNNSSRETEFNKSSYSYINETEPEMAKPFQPIPMPYESLNQKDSKSDCGAIVSVKPEDKYLALSAFSEHFIASSWSEKINILLLQKASIVELILAKIYFGSQRYGLALQKIRYSIQAWYAVAKKLNIKREDVPVPSQALSLAGDTLFMVSKNWNVAYDEEYSNENENFQLLSDILEEIMPIEDLEWNVKYPSDITESMFHSCNCFENALLGAEADAVSPLSRKLGCVYNELAVVYMNQAAKLCEDSVTGLEAAGDLWKKSALVLSKGIDLFEKVRDNDNIALLHSNSGRLLRLCAYHCLKGDDVRRYSPKEKYYYDQAVDEYELALTTIKGHKKTSEIYSLVQWEFSTMLFNIGTIMQDYPPAFMNSDDCEREIIDIFNKALKYCDIKTPGAHQPLYQYRCAVIYTRLAALHLKSQRFSGSDDRNRNYLTDLYYKKGASLFLSLDNFGDFLNTQLDRIKFVEDQIKGAKNLQIMIKLHISILNIYIECMQALNALSSKECVMSTDHIEKSVSHTKKLKQRKKKIRKKSTGQTDSAKDLNNCQLEGELIVNNKDSENLSKDKDTQLCEETEQVEKVLFALEQSLRSNLLSFIKVISNSGSSAKLNTDSLKKMYLSSINSSHESCLLRLQNAVAEVSANLPHLTVRK